MPLRKLSTRDKQKHPRPAPDVVQMIPLDKIDPNPDQPRKRFTGIKELAASESCRVIRLENLFTNRITPPCTRSRAKRDSRSAANEVRQH
jgi:hypothetical protein